MAKSFLLNPADAVVRLQKRFHNQRGNWLRQEGEWPLRIPLGLPSERQAMEHPTAVREWQARWAQRSGAGEVSWTERQWRLLGTQRLPESLSFNAPEEVARFIGHEEGWIRAVRRFQLVTSTRPALEDAAVRSLDVLTEWEETDFERLIVLLDWLEANPRSGLYPRQLPVPGLDSKWLETRRKAVCSWLCALSGVGEQSEDLYSLAGLRRPPQLLRMRVLDPVLRERLGGLEYLHAPVAEMARLDLPIELAFIVENIQTGLAFEDIKGAVVFMGQGYTVEPFGELPWLADIPSFYWGDMDTHGFAILSRLRRFLPAVRSLLMDSETLVAHRSFWGHEPKPSTELELQGLEPEERLVFEGLKSNRWGTSPRLEQERIPWDYAVARIRQAASGGVQSPREIPNDRVN